MKKALIPENFQVAIVALVVFLLYILALLFPENWWGLHYPAFLGGGKGWLIVFAAIGFTLYSVKNSFWEKLHGKNLMGNNWLWIAIITILSGFFFYQMPIYKDIYGDALTIIPTPEFVNPEFTEKQRAMLTSLDFTNLKIGYETVLGMVAWLSYTKEMELGEAFRTIGAVSGMGYVFFMLATAFRIARNNLQKLLFGLMILGAPFTLSFCGHIEIYAPIFFLLAAFWYAMVRFLENSSWVTGAIVLLLCLVNLKFHISGIVTFLIFGVALLMVLLKRSGKDVSWNKFGLAVLGVFIGIGFAVYAFVTKSIFASRSYTEDNLTDAIFLPIKATDQAPLNRYNLFSWNHIFDYFNMAFLWSAMAIIVIAVALIFKRKKINWNHPLVMTSGLAFIFYFFTFFVLNPLLSMPTDWDLMSIPAIALMMFAFTIVTHMKAEETESRSFSSYLIAPALGFCLIALSGIFVNANKNALSNRLMSMGKHSFKTYWIGSSTPITEAVRLQDDEKDQFKMLEKAVLDLESHHVEGADLEYAALLNLMGEYHLQLFKDPIEAHKWYLKSEKADKQLLANIESLAHSYFRRKEYQAALPYVKNLVFNKYPNESEALQLAIEVTIKMDDLANAQMLSEQLLAINPQNKMLAELNEMLRSDPDKSKVDDFVSRNLQHNNQSGKNEQLLEKKYKKLVSLFTQKEFDKAFEISKVLVQNEYPNKLKALRVAIHCALEAEEYAAAESFCQQLLRSSPSDSFIAEILELLQTSKDKSKIKLRFRQS